MAALLFTSIVGIITGPLYANAMPYWWIITDKVLGGFGARLDRVQRKPADLAFRGFLLTVLALAAFYFIGKGVAELAWKYPLAGFTEVFCLSMVLTSGTVWFSLLRLYYALKDKKIVKNAYYTMATTTRSDLSLSDDYTITRVGMGLAARSFDKGVVAPVLWYLILGLPGAYIYTALAALAWRFGKDGFTKGFGKVPLALEQLMGMVPTALSGLLMTFAGLLTPTGGMTRALIGIMRAHNRTPYAEGGLPVTAMANSLKVGLGGPTTDLDGSAIPRIWTGPEGATAKLEPGHLRRAIYISLMAHLLFLAAMGSSLLYAGRIFG